MSELIIKNEWVDIFVDDIVDCDGQLELSLGCQVGFIEKQHAIEIIKHLSKVFDFKLVEID